MLNLIPQVKEIRYSSGKLCRCAVSCVSGAHSPRLERALGKLPYADNGAVLTVTYSNGTDESYELTVNEESIAITAKNEAGAFYAIQTLRQLFTHDEIPCLHISDSPDFAYRGFYHDVTRGKIPTLDTLKKLVDLLAYCKINSLQLYVEHTFAFEQCQKLCEKTGALTADEIRELDLYCRDNFIDFIPSLATFGHMYEILELPEYRHLRSIRGYDAPENRWNERMAHHTIDPENPESLKLVSSLIDQYCPLFSSDTFNICCDETFDLHRHPSERDKGKMYIDFVKKIVSHLSRRGKRVMMWGDILLAHPETISELPDDVIFLNWDYGRNPYEGNVIRFAEMKRPQIVCPGTGTWSRLTESADSSEENIAKMTEYGHRHGALGVLNTNWGDWGNPCPLELSLYNTVFGAERSWNVSTEPDERYKDAVEHLIYAKNGAVAAVKALSRLHDRVNWNRFCASYFEHRKTGAITSPVSAEYVASVTDAYREFADRLASETWEREEIREEMLIAAEGTAVIAELMGVMSTLRIDRVTDTYAWLGRYKEKWLGKNKPSELYRIEEMFRYFG